jgi:hypothetical protein
MCLDLDLVQEGGDAGKHRASPEESFAILDQVCDTVSTIADTFLELGRDQRDSFRLVELEAPG